MHYALAKPTKEALYAALPDDVQYRAKPTLDTIVNRIGTLIGSAFFALCLAHGVAPLHRRIVVLTLTVAWGYVALHMGRLASEDRAADTAATLNTAIGHDTSAKHTDSINSAVVHASAPPSVDVRSPQSVRSQLTSVAIIPPPLTERLSNGGRVLM